MSARNEKIRMELRQEVKAKQDELIAAFIKLRTELCRAGSYISAALDDKNRFSALDIVYTEKLEPISLIESGRAWVEFSLTPIMALREELAEAAWKLAEFNKESE